MDFLMSLSEGTQFAIQLIVVLICFMGRARAESRLGF